MFKKSSSFLPKFYLIPVWLLMSALLFVACDDEDGILDEEDDSPIVEDVEEKENILREGFIVRVITPNEDHIVKYFDELPSGSADLSDGQTFQAFNVRDIYSNAMFLAKSDGSNFYSRMIVDTTGTIIESGSISVVGDSPVTIKVVDDSTGVLHDRGSSTTLSVFNPTTMEIEGVIDMSAGGYSDQRFQSLYFSGDVVYAPLRPEIGGVYDKMIVQSANFKMGQYLNTTEFDTGRTFPNDEFGQNNVDELGNVYVPSYGDPASGQGIASIHKIPVGSTEFDEDYNFIPALVANPTNTFLPTFGDFNYYKDDIAFALVAVSVPQELIDLVISVGGNPADLSPAQIQEALGILFAAENARWSKLNMTDQTVEIIENIPAQSPFTSAAYLATDEGDIYLSVDNTETSAFYKYNVDNDTAEKAFDVIGGSISGLHDISQNH